MAYDPDLNGQSIERKVTPAEVLQAFVGTKAAPTARVDAATEQSRQAAAEMIERGYAKLEELRKSPELAPTVESEATEDDQIRFIEDPILIEQIRASIEGRKPRIVADIEPTLGMPLTRAGEKSPEFALLNEINMAVNLISAFKNLFGASHQTVLHSGEGGFSVDHYVAASMRAELEGRTKMERLYAISGGVLPVIGDYITEAEREVTSAGKREVKRGQGVVLVFYPPAGDARITRRKLERVVIQDGLYADGAGNRIEKSGREIVSQYGGLPMVYVPASVLRRHGLAVFNCDFAFEDEDKDKVGPEPMIVTAQLDAAMLHDFLKREEFDHLQEMVGALAARKRHEAELAAGGTLQLSVEGGAQVHLRIEDSLKDPMPNADVAFERKVWPGEQQLPVRVVAGKVTLSIGDLDQSPRHFFGVEVRTAAGQLLHHFESTDELPTFEIEAGQQYDVRVYQYEIESDAGSPVEKTERIGHVSELEGMVAERSYPDSEPMHVLGREYETEESIRSRETFLALGRVKAGASSSYTVYGLNAYGERVGGYASDSDLGLQPGDSISGITLEQVKAALARKGNENKQADWALNRIVAAAEHSDYIGGAFELMSTTSSQSQETLYREFATELVGAVKRSSFESRTLRKGTKLFSVSANHNYSVTNLEMAGSLKAQVATLDIQGFKVEVAILPCRNVAILKIWYHYERITQREELLILGRSRRKQGWYAQKEYAERGQRTTYETVTKQPVPYLSYVPEVDVDQNVAGDVLSLIQRQSQGQAQQQEMQQFQTMWNNMPIDVRVAIINEILNQNLNTTNVTGQQEFEEMEALIAQENGTTRDESTSLRGAIAASLEKPLPAGSTWNQRQSAGVMNRAARRAARTSA